jgi:hypothetical protein
VTSTETKETGGIEIVNTPKTGRRIKNAVSLVTVGAFALIVVTKRTALASSFAHLGHPHWSWIPVAVALELVSMGTFALMQRELLSSGGMRVAQR